MDQPDQPRRRARARGATRGVTWDRDVPRPPFVWPAGIATAGRRARETLTRFAAAEVAPGRLTPWLAIAFGFGIVLYFTAAQEPLWPAAAGLALAAAVAAVLARRRPLAFPLALGIAAIAAGFAAATLKTWAIEHPVLTAPAFGVSVSGFVELREERARSDRIVVRVERIEGVRQRLERVRVAVRRGTAPPVGAFVTFKARLSPPLQALRPGGYDFARDLYFQRIGASGFVLGRIATGEPPVPLGLRLRFAAAVDALRDAMDGRIRAVLPGDKGAIASALITGKRDAITAPVNEAMYVSSLAHVLSISGYHMAVVAGLVFFIVRALLALIPGASDRHPIKKWAAIAALGAASFYLVLSGAEVATQRSFIMVAIVLLGVMLDRPALTLRTLTAAALAVMVLTPEAVVHPSFQMSFAATLALVAGYQSGLPWRAGADSSLGARIALWGGRELAGLVLASAVAGLATTLYAAFHFHRLAPYGVLANLAAMPVVSAFVMPMGMLGALAMPFGFDGPCWRAMGLGLDWMVAVALWVTALPGAVGRMAAFGTGALLLGTLALVLICLLRTPLRWSGALIAAAAVALALTTPRPDILVATDGQAVAVRGRDGRLTVARMGSDSFAVRDWLAADGDVRAVDDASLGEGVRCDRAGCMLPLADGRLVAFVREIEAFAEDCTRAAVVASPRPAQRACGALLIDREALRASGAVALYADGDGFSVTAARPAGVNRPWTRSGAQSRAPSSAPAPATPARTVPPDATPPADALQTGD